MSAAADAQMVNMVPAVRLVTQAVGQTESTASRRESDELLRRARTAMKAGDTKQAFTYLKRVEQMEVKYDGLLQRFGDTPVKLRRDLEKIDPALFVGELSQATAEALPLPDDLVAQQDNLLPAPVTTVSGATSTDPGPVAANLNPPETQELSSQKSRVLQLLAQSKLALDKGELVRAERLATEARAIGLPDEVYQADDARPWKILLEIERAKHMSQGTARIQPVVTDDVVRKAGVTSSDDLSGIVQLAAGQIEFPDATDDFPNDFVADPPFANEPPTAPTASRVGDRSSPGYELMKQGEDAIKVRDFAAAREKFRAAWKYEEELDPATRQRLQDNLQLNNVLVAKNEAEEVPAPRVSTAEEAAARRFAAEISRQESAIRRQLRDDPRGAWDALEQLKRRVQDAEIHDGARERLLSRVEQSIADAEEFIDMNRARIELDERNRSVLAEVDRRRKHKIDVDEELAGMVDEFNTLMDQERFSEAVVIAKKARELAPTNAVVESMHWKSRFAERLMIELSMDGRREEGVVGTLDSVVESGIPFDDRLGIEFPNARSWKDLTDRRLRALRESGRQLSETELAIRRALRRTVQVQFKDQPLSEVLNQLGDLAGISIYLDPEGLAAEGASTDMLVTIQLNQEIQLKSALNIILGQFGLSYLIQDEVLKVTSESIRASKTYVDTYSVGDLVIPIPNFMPTYDMGLPSAIREAYNAQGWGTSFQGGYNRAPLAVMANNQPNDGGMVGSQTLAQMAASEMMPAGSASPQPLGFGPGGLGGGANADFDTLIDLIQATIAPNSWDDVGGEGSIQSFPTNLSLVVSQTQEVHEQIADLLTQLRRLQDLQVTIEVRFITLSDNFFERIGVDFDFDIDDNVTQIPEDDSGPSVTIGLDPQGNPTADLDISFTQGSFGESTPQFGNFNQATAANIGFAILSDIEAFFVIEAAQGDTRTNVLQAPKVTLFNGQQASVNDTSQKPFVTSVTPVVGDFAAAQAPIIVVLSEGTSLTVQAVVSNDRRFVRLTLVPFFSKIGDVEEFTFEGRRSTNSGTFIADPTDDTQTVADNEEEFVEGTTVQLPQFSFTSVSTTVSVPDGGTILLGGIKRLSEGRNERGLPVASKLPYINRLFRNVGIGRTTESLMMMVTPRIIIQEEEEEKLGISTTDN